MKRSRLFLVLLLCLALILQLSSALGEIIPVTLSDEGCSCDSSAVTCEGSKVTITAPGEYMLTGTLSNGQVFVDCSEDGKVTLHLNNAIIHNETGAAILVGDVSPRIRISLTAGSENKLSNGSKLVFTDSDEPNGVIFSRSDLTIEGSGKLTVTAGDYDGIVSKDDIRVEGGDITVSAVRHGIRGKDSVEIYDGVISITCGKDGLRTTNTTDADRGYITVSGGQITIVCGDDPLDFVTALNITGGTVNGQVSSSAD